MSQLLEVDDLTGHLTTDENRALIEEVTIFPLLQYKLQLLVHLLRNGPKADRFVCQVASAFPLFQMGKKSVQSSRNSKGTCFTKLSKFPSLMQLGNMMGSCNRKVLPSSMPTRFSPFLYYYLRQKKLSSIF